MSNDPKDPPKQPEKPAAPPSTMREKPKEPEARPMAKQPEKPAADVKPKEPEPKPMVTRTVVSVDAKPKEPEAKPLSSTKPPDAKPKEPEARPMKQQPPPVERQKPPEAKAKAPDPKSAEPMVSSSSSRPRAAFVEPSLSAVDALDCEALAICICSDVRPLAGVASFVDWRMCGRISALMRRGLITGAAQERVLVPTLGMIPAKRIFLFGWGPQKSMLDNAAGRFNWMIDTMLRAKIERVAVALPEPCVMLLGLVDEHVRKPLGDKCSVVFGPDSLLVEAKDTRPIPAPVLGMPS